MRRQPDYSFKNGLVIDVNTFHTDNSAGKRELIVSPDELRKTPKSGDNKKRDAVVHEKMINPTLVKGIGGVALETVVIGPEDADAVNFVFYGWGGNTRHPVAIDEAQALVASDPEANWVFMNTFGTGKSSLLPKNAANDVRKHGNYNGMGSYVAAVANRIAEGRSVSLMGHSLGARTAVGAVPHMEINPEALILNDPTGTLRMSLAEIAVRFGVIEGGHIGKYMSGGFDPEAADLQKHGKIQKELLEGRTKGGWKQQFLIDPSGLSKPGFGEDFTRAVPFVENEIRVISPEQSALNSPGTIHKIMALARSENQQTLMEQWVLRDHTHSVVTIPQVLARLYGQLA